MGLKYIEVDGVPVVEDDVFKWAAWYEKADRRVAYTEVEELRVSTVFLGIDHDFSFKGPPVLYVTMVFPLDNCREEYQERYRTREEARAGHERAVEWAKAHQPT